MIFLFENCIENNSLFSPHIQEEKISSVYRTINSCEYFRSKCNFQFYSPHPNTYNFIDALYDIQTGTEMVIRSSDTQKIFKTKCIL